MSLTVGSRVGPFEILARLGDGGTGEVYRARDTSLRRDVAIKVLPASYSRDPDRLRRFELGAQAAAALNHPNILSIFHVGEHDGAPYIVTELLEGETLRNRLRREPMICVKRWTSLLKWRTGLRRLTKIGSSTKILNRTTSS
jgi:serine/threonine protein kinase